jgi:hypothetical protein
VARPLGPTLRRAEREEGAPLIHRNRHLLVQLERPREERERILELAGLRRDEPPAACAARERGHSPEPACVSLVPIEQADGVVHSPQLHQRLDVVDGEAGRSGLDDALPAHELDARIQVRDDVVWLSERVIEVSERTRAHEAGMPVRGDLEGMRGCPPRFVGATELCLHEALECEAEPAEQPLSRLLCRLARLAREPERSLELAEDELDLTEQHEQPWPGVLVAELLGAAHQVDERGTCPFLRVRPSPVLGQGDERLIQDATIHRGLLECERLLRDRGRRRQSEQRLGRQARHQDVARERGISDIGGKGESDARVLNRLLKILEHPDAARSDTLMGDRECLEIVTGFLDNLREEPARIGRRLVETDTREHNQSSCSQWACSEGCDQILQLRLGASRVT